VRAHNFRVIPSVLHANLHPSERELPHPVEWLRGNGTLRALAARHRDDIRLEKTSAAPLHRLKRGTAMAAPRNNRCRDQPAPRAAGMRLHARLASTRHGALTADLR
jgi:hypothetical protein